jgi:spermidine synthase
LSTLDVNRPVVGLIGSNEPTSYPARWFDRRVVDPRLQNEIRKAGLTNQLALFGLRVASTERLRRFAGNGPINTDDYPVITFDAPRFIYSRQPVGFVILRHLLDVPVPAANEKITNDAAFAEQLAQFGQARDIFLRAEMDRASGQMSRAMDGYVAALKASGDFDLAYARAFLYARSRARRDPQLAAEILERIDEVRPLQAEGTALLQQIRGEQARRASSAK